MVATSHCLGLRPCVEVVDMILDEAAVQPEDRSLAGAPQPLQQPAGELQIGRRLIGIEIGGTAFSAAREVDVVVAVRWEEQTYELQSLMRNSSAVFCFTKNNSIHINNTI